QETASRPQHPPHLCDRGVERLDVLEDQAGDDGVESPVAERQRRRAPAHVDGPAGASDRDLQLRPRRLDADDARVWSRHASEASNLSLAGADVEHLLCSREMVRRERQDLFGIFGVGALGERVLPPAGVQLPGVAALPWLPGHGSSVSPKWGADAATRRPRLLADPASCSAKPPSRWLSAPRSEMLRRAVRQAGPEPAPRIDA